MRYGTYAPEKLVAEAARRGIDTLVLTDIKNTSCSYQFIQACKEYNIRPILGIEYRQDLELCFIGIARNEEGWRELCAYLTECSLEGKDIPHQAPQFEHCYVIYRKPPGSVTHLRPWEYVGILPEEANRLYSSYLRDHTDKLVVLSPVTFADGEHFRLHRLLRCIDLNIIIGKLQPHQHARSTEHFHTHEYFSKAFERYPVIIENTRHILSSCSIDMDSGSQLNRQSFTGDHHDDMQLLTKLAVSGCRQRYSSSHKKAMERTLKELQVIERMKFCTYFLITWDIIRYARTIGYHHVGRGSGANSIVAFNLGITDVDPLELDLYFERFINPHRSSPPDFDIDFSWDERDDVTDYIFKRYGREHTALLATYNTFKGKSIIRELGKVVGLPKADIDLIVEEPLAEEKHHPFAKHIFKLGKLMEGFPNYLSIHAGGVLISEEPLNYHTALQLMPKGFPIVHFDMYGAEDLGYHKYDVLSQRGLGHIKSAVDLIRKNRGRAVDIHDVARIKEDPAVKARLRSGQCIGCFYIESPAMRGLLTKLTCDNYVHLVAASSIIRPGVAQSGMMREYIQRFHRPESFNYIHPVFEEHLKETFGVMVYQEDVMKIVHHFAGLDLDESDVLRRVMTGKKKDSDTFRNLQKKFFDNCQQRGYPETLSHEVWRQIESFSGYSFCKAHSASYAVESFQSLYLKTYYPLEFMVAVINNFGGFYSTEQYVHEARMAGARIEPPCVNHSLHLTHIEGDTIYLGFIHMASLEQKVAHTIVEERERSGLYRDLPDFIHRVHIGKEQIELLIRIGAFRFTGRSKYELMWDKNAVYSPGIKQQQYAATLFCTEPEEYELPVLEETLHEQAFDEIEILGFPLCSPFELISAEVSGDIPAKDMNKYLGKYVKILGYYVCRKHVTTIRKQHMNFGTWTDREGHFFDSVHFPPALAAHPFRGRGCYLLTGKIVEDFGFPSMEVSKMEKLGWVQAL
jgi:DNA-directed DNA polymerase III PolC